MCRRGAHCIPLAAHRFRIPCPCGLRAWMGSTTSGARNQWSLPLPHECEPKMKPFTIRPASSTDDAALAELLTQLGYPATAEEAAARLTSYHSGGALLRGGNRWGRGWICELPRDAAHACRWLPRTHHGHVRAERPPPQRHRDEHPGCDSPPRPPSRMQADRSHQRRPPRG